MKRSGIQTEIVPHNEFSPWRAFVGRVETGNGIYYGSLATGETEEEAIANLAGKMNLRLWNDPK